MTRKLVFFTFLFSAFLIKAQDVAVFSDTAETNKSYFFYKLDALNDTVIIDSLTLLGTLVIEGKSYKVISIFRLVKTATSWRGNTQIKFYSEEKEFIYYLDNRKCLPNRISNNQLIFKDEKINIEKLRDTICIPCGCF